jgi:prophage tail gpP-like protein
LKKFKRKIKQSNLKLFLNLNYLITFLIIIEQIYKLKKKKKKKKRKGKERKGKKERKKNNNN